MVDFSNTELFMGGLVLLTTVVSRALKRFVPKPPKNKQRTVVIREMITKKEIIREPIHSSKGVSIICPYCNKVFR